MREPGIETVTTGRRFASPRLTELRPLRRATDSAGIESAEVAVPAFDRAVLSWNGDGKWRMEMRARVGGQWSPYLTLGVIDGGAQRSATRAETPEAKPVGLAIDTLTVRGATADAFQVRAVGEGELRALAVTHYRRDDRRYTASPAAPAWGVTLPVPERRQGDVEDPALRPDVCSPTSVSMVLEYHGVARRTLDVCRAVYDNTARLYGNWPMNTAVAARLLNGWAVVVKMTGFDEVEKEIAARRPVILSHRWERGQLTNAPVSRSNGHLIVAVGFTAQGDVVVNDPAGKPGAVRRVYKREELFRTWQEGGEGIAYVIHPGAGQAAQRTRRASRE
jgi:hypothetical protein